MASDRDELMRLVAKWRSENGDYPEAKRDCADELERALAQRAPQNGAELTDDDLRLRCGEMTPSELRACRAGYRLSCSSQHGAVPEGFEIQRIDRQTRLAGRVFGLQIITPLGDDGMHGACFLDGSAHHAAIELIDALLAAAPAPEASKCGPACARCGSTTGAACSDHGCHYLTAGNAAPEAERAEGDDETWIPPSIENTVRAAVKEWDECRSPIDAQAAMHKIANCLAHHPAPPPAGQPEGVQASLLELIANRVEVMADKYDSDGMRAIAADARRLASAQRAGKDGA